MTNSTQWQEYSLRMVVAELFRSAMRKPEERARVLRRAGTDSMPVVIPALEDTLAIHISDAAKRHFEAGEECVIVPVGSLPQANGPLQVTVLALSNAELESFWQLDLEDMPAGTEMKQVIEVLDPDKKWDIADLDEELMTGLL